MRCRLKRPFSLTLRKKCADQLGLEVAQALDAEPHFEVEEGAARQVDASEHERVIERYIDRAKAREAALLSQRPIHRAAERDPDVFDEMMLVQAVAGRTQRQAAARMFGERLEHVVEKLHVGRDGDRTAVEREFEVDRRFFGRARDRRPARAVFDQAEAPAACGVPLPRPSPFFPRPRDSIGTHGMTGGPV